LPNSAQTANLNDRPRRGWRAKSGPQQHKAKTEGNENQSEENSTEEWRISCPRNQSQELR